MSDAELAWELADTARGHLDATQRNEIYMAIAVGDAFWAIRLLLRTVVRFELGVGADLLPKLLGWVTSYRDHPEQGHLRHLIGRVRIQPVRPIRRVSGNLPPALRRARPEDSRRFGRRKPLIDDFSRRPAAHQRTGSFGYE
jgi:hypothetical protein